MTAFDYVVIAILLVMTIRGALKGLVAQIASVAGVFLGWIVAARGSGLVAPALPVEEPYNRYFAMLLLFIGVSIGCWLVARVVVKTLKLAKLKSFDTHLGTLAGLLKGLLIAMALTFFGVSLSEKSRTWVLSSRTGHYLALAIDKTGALIPGDVCEKLREQIDDFRAKVAAEQGADWNEISWERQGEGGFLRGGSANTAGAAGLSENADGQGGESKSQGLVGSVLSWFGWGDDEQTDEPEPAQSDVRKLADTLGKVADLYDGIQTRQVAPQPSAQLAEGEGVFVPEDPVFHPGVVDNALKSVAENTSASSARTSSSRMAPALLPAPQASPSLSAVPSQYARTQEVQVQYGSVGGTSELRPFTPISGDAPQPDSTGGFNPADWLRSLGH